MATLQTAGSWAITAGDGVYSGASAPVTVTAAAAAGVAFSQPPGGASAGGTFSPVTVDVVDPLWKPDLLRQR